MEQVKSILQHVKDVNGEYFIQLSYNTLDEVLESLESGKTLRQINSEINDKQEGLLDDLATVVYNLAGLLDNRLELNHIYRENFKDESNLSITSGTFEQGSIKSANNESIDFQLKQPKELRLQPEKLKLSHMIKYTGNPNLSCQITFNALDTNPVWFDVNEALLSSSFFDIPKISKEEGKPYALNIRIQGLCDNSSTIEISDLMVLFI